MKELYMNIWIYDDKDLIVEHEPCLSLDEAINDYKENSNFFNYSHTIMIDFEGGLKSTLEMAWSKKIDIKGYINALEQENDNDYNPYVSETLSLQQKGISNGRE